MKLFDWLNPKVESDVNLSRRKLFTQAGTAAIAAPLVAKALSQPAKDLTPAAAQQTVRYQEPDGFSCSAVSGSWLVRRSDFTLAQTASLRHEWKR